MSEQPKMIAGLSTYTVTVYKSVKGEYVRLSRTVTIAQSEKAAKIMAVEGYRARNKLSPSHQLYAEVV